MIPESRSRRTLLAAFLSMGLPVAAAQTEPGATPGRTCPFLEALEKVHERIAGTRDEAELARLRQTRRELLSQVSSKVEANLKEADREYQEAGAGLRLSVAQTFAKSEDLLRLWQEGKTKGNLGMIRAALSVYYGDHQGIYPQKVEELLPQYMGSVPPILLPGTGHSASVQVLVLTQVKDEADLRSQLKDSGQWVYVADPYSPERGMFLIDCIHSDLKGNPWSRY